MGGRKYVLKEVVKPLGRCVFRVWLGSHFSLAMRSPKNSGQWER